MSLGWAVYFRGVTAYRNLPPGQSSPRSPRRGNDGNDGNDDGYDASSPTQFFFPRSQGGFALLQLRWKSPGIRNSEQ